MADKLLVYISSPYSGNVALNIPKARLCCRYAVNKGCAPFAPHLLFPQFMEEKTERGLAMDMCLSALERCDELWVFGSEISSGMKAEIKKAEQLGKPVRYIDFSGENAENSKGIE